VTVDRLHEVDAPLHNITRQRRTAAEADDVARGGEAGRGLARGGPAAAGFAGGGDGCGAVRLRGGAGGITKTERLNKRAQGHSLRSGQ
jgi:hypothetical protein